MLLQSVFFCEQSHATVCWTHSPPPSYPLIPLTSLTPFRKTLLITSQHTGKTYLFNLSWNVTMPADDTNVNKNPISWRSVVQSSNSVLRKIFSWGKAIKCYRMFYARKYRMSRKKVLKIADFKLCNLLICCTHSHAHNHPPGCPPRNPPIILPNQASSWKCFVVQTC